MVAQAASTPTAAMLSTISKAWLGLTALSTTPNSPMVAVSRIPPYGTPFFDIRPVNSGPLPFTDIDRKIRPVEYSPAFRLENPAGRTTTFINRPAPLKPILEEKGTNGLSPGL